MNSHRHYHLAVKCIRDSKETANKHPKAAEKGEIMTGKTG